LQSRLNKTEKIDKDLKDRGNTVEHKVGDITSRANEHKVGDITSRANEHLAEVNEMAIQAHRAFDQKTEDVERSWAEEGNAAVRLQTAVEAEAQLTDGKSEAATKHLSITSAKLSAAEKETEKLGYWVSRSKLAGEIRSEAYVELKANLDNER
jgi:hypothetical protein